MSIKEKGFSAVEAILIIVIIGIVGFAGWFVWNSQKQTDKTLTDTSKGNTSVVATKTSQSTTNGNTIDSSLQEVSVEGGHATVQAPKSWKVTVGDANDSSSMFKTVKITSSDGKTVVTFGRLGGLGGYCDPTEGRTMTKLKVAQLTNTPSLSYVEYLQSDGKVYKMDIFPTTKAEKLQNGASVCDAYLGEVMENYKGYSGNAVFSISYAPFATKLGDSTSTAAPITSAEYIAYTDSADYQTAKSILLSLKY